MIKRSLTMSADMLDGLLWWIKLAGLPPGAGALVYGGDETFARNNVPIRPWFAV